MKDADWGFDTLKPRIKNARRLAIVGIGDELLPPDRLGMLAVREFEQQPLPGVGIFFAGTVPESITGPLRRFRPGHVLFLDAADMGARPGTIAVIEPERIQASLISTHILPLSVVMDYIEREIGAGVTLLGIQPDLTGADKDLSAEDREYLGRNLLLLSQIFRTGRNTHQGFSEPGMAAIAGLQYSFTRKGEPGKKIANPVAAYTSVRYRIQCPHPGIVRK